MTAPPREIALEPCANCGKARSDHYIVNFADGPQISGMTWICPGSVYEASPAPSAEPPAQAATDDLVRRLTARAAYVRGEYRQDLRDAADLIERQAREMAELQRKLTNEENYYEDMKIRAERAESALADKARILERCRVVLGNMAQENVGAIFNRWPISHEPLRNDARGLLPDIDAVLGDSNG